jgi:chromosome partitioning protein
VNPELSAYCFINRADHQGSYNQETRDVLTDSDAVEFIDAPLGNRKSFAIAFDYGQSVVEYKPRDKKAIREMNQLFETVFDIVSVPE